MEEEKKLKTNISSNCYVPYQNENVKDEKDRDDRNDLQSKIIKEIRSLYTGKILLGSFYEKPENNENKNNSLYDVENRLFYNIGSSNFHDVAPTQLAFMESKIRFDKNEFNCNKQYNYLYELVEKEEISDIIKNKTVLAKWENTKINKKIKNGPARYFAAIRDDENKDTIEPLEEKDYEGDFGIKVELTVPYCTHPAAAMKPLLDGIICAFHGEENQEKTRGRLQKKIGEHFKDEMQNKDYNLFGNYEYIRKNLAWNPADDRLKFAWIIVKLRTKPDETCKMSGTIFKWN